MQCAYICICTYICIKYKYIYFYSVFVVYLPKRLEDVVVLTPEKVAFEVRT